MKKWLGYGILCLLIPAVVLGGALIFRDRQYAYITLCVAVLSCLPFFLHFERSANDVKRLILIAVMVALSVAGRMLFAPLQHFKPVTALVIISAARRAFSPGRSAPCFPISISGRVLGRRFRCFPGA